MSTTALSFFLVVRVSLGSIATPLNRSASTNLPTLSSLANSVHAKSELSKTASSKIKHREAILTSEASQPPGEGRAYTLQAMSLALNKFRAKAAPLAAANKADSPAAVLIALTKKTTRLRDGVSIFKALYSRDVRLIVLIAAIFYSALPQRRKSKMGKLFLFLSDFENKKLKVQNF